MIATAAPIEAVRAHQFGFVNRLVLRGQVVEQALALAREITVTAPLAVRESLRVARAAADLSEAELRQLSAESMAAVSRSEDYQEGPRAFIEKRRPLWTGR